MASPLRLCIPFEYCAKHSTCDFQAGCKCFVEEPNVGNFEARVYFSDSREPLSQDVPTPEAVRALQFASSPSQGLSSAGSSQPVRLVNTPPPVIRPTDTPTPSPSTPPVVCPTFSPTLRPTTPEPTFDPTQRFSTSQPTRYPTPLPATPSPTPHPTTSEPTLRTTTSKPTSRPTTSEPTPCPTTSEPTPCPITSEPTPHPINSEPTFYPTPRTSTHPPTFYPTPPPTTSASFLNQHYVLLAQNQRLIKRNTLPHPRLKILHLLQRTHQHLFLHPFRLLALQTRKYAQTVQMILATS